MAGIFKRWRGLILLSVVLLSGCTSLTGLYFYPRSLWLQTPDDFGVSYDDVWLTSADGTKVHAWHLRPQQEQPQLQHQLLLAVT